MLGEYIHSKNGKGRVWSCKDCNWIHRRRTAGRIYRLIRREGAALRKDTPLRKAQRKRLRESRVGIIILGHGSRLPKANALIPKAIKKLKMSLGVNKIYPAYLQLAAPDVSEVIKKLARRKCAKIVIVPFFLFVGNHVSRDIPEILKREKERFPNIKFIYAKNLGQDARVVDIVTDNIKDAC